jgi:predicted nucleic acid-binding protein
MIRSRVLIDAGPMVAILSESDSAHESCVAVMKALAPPLFTTWIPVTEVMYLLGFSTAAQLGLLQMIERGAIRVLDLGPADLPHIRASMDKYRDLPMDFADASLMRIAAREGIDRIFTLDRRDFEIYRLPSRRALRILPEI